MMMRSASALAQRLTNMCGSILWSSLLLLLQRVRIAGGSPSQGTTQVIEAPSQASLLHPSESHKSVGRLGLATVPLPVPSTAGPPAVAANALHLPWEAVGQAGVQGSSGNWIYGWVLAATGTGATQLAKRRQRRRRGGRGHEEMQALPVGTMIPIVVGGAGAYQFQALRPLAPSQPSNMQAAMPMTPEQWSSQQPEEAENEEDEEIDEQEPQQQHWDTDSDDELKFHPQALVHHWPQQAFPMDQQQQLQPLQQPFWVPSPAPATTQRATAKVSRGAVSQSEQEQMRRAVEEVQKRLGKSSGSGQALPNVFINPAVQSAQAQPMMQTQSATSSSSSSQSSRQQTQHQAQPTGAQSQIPPSTPKSDAADSLPSSSFASVGADVVIKELEEGTAEERKACLEWIVASAWPMALTKHGCLMVQKAFEVADTQDKLALAAKLRGHVLECVKSRHANFVLQKCIVELAQGQVEFILAELRGQTAEVAKHRYGCRVLQRLLEHCSSSQTEDIVDEVVGGLVGLCRHAFGNYVVQHVLEHGTAAQRAQIASILVSDEKRLIALARHRVASHVVQSALVYCSTEDREHLEQALSSNPSDRAGLASSFYGSYVAQELGRPASSTTPSVSDLVPEEHDHELFEVAENA